MADIAIVLLFPDNNDEDDVQVIRISRKRLRDQSDPFAVSENQFRVIYRISKEACRELIEQLKPLMPARRRSTSIPTELQILASLNFFASGSYQRRVGQDFLTCMSQTSISTALHATVYALNRMMKNWIRFPVTAERIQSIKQEFFVKTGFPGVIGAIDGSHIAIFPPEAEREHLFINRKLYHSLNVLAICDYKGEILFVNSAHGGRTHDSRVFRSSRLFTHLIEKYRQGEMDSWLLGDSAYPLHPFLLTPKLNQEEGPPGARYTEHHIRARVAIERCFGILKGRWRCLRRERALHYQPEFAALIVNACCVLHNIAIRWGIHLDEMYYDDIDHEPVQPYDGNPAHGGEEVRNRLIEWYFTE